MTNVAVSSILSQWKWQKHVYGMNRQLHFHHKHWLNRQFTETKLDFFQGDWKSAEGFSSIILHLTWFQVLLSLSTEYLSPFHHCTCILLVSSIIFSLWGYLPPLFRLHSQTAGLFIIPRKYMTQQGFECQQGFHLVLWRKIFQISKAFFIQNPFIKWPLLQNRFYCVNISWHKLSLHIMMRHSISLPTTHILKYGLLMKSLFTRWY